MLHLIASHPIADAIALVAILVALSVIWTITAATIAAILHGGQYRGQQIGALESAGIFGVGFLILCAPVLACWIFGG